jgi:hypothetical protein
MLYTCGMVCAHHGKRLMTDLGAEYEGSDDMCVMVCV